MILLKGISIMMMGLVLNGLSSIPPVVVVAEEEEVDPTQTLM